MTNNEIMDYIYKSRVHKDKNDNSRMITLLNYLDNPQDDLKFIHVAGTNGKGSVTTMMANVLKNSGYKVGKYISPYIISFNERIQINNDFITNEDLSRYIKIISKFVDNMEVNGDAPIAFEIITAIAFLYFKDENCDFACLETGMGGRLDPTNVITTTILSIITLIDFDHVQFLGNTLEDIATEKCGIIKKDKITVTYPLHQKEVLNTIRIHCSKNNNKLYIPNIKLLDIIKCNHSINYFSYKDHYYKLGLIGEYQIYNALMVIVATNILINLGYKISFSAINNGLLETTFPARLEKINNSPFTVLDGSHNIAGARALKEFLREYKGRKNYAIISMTENKDHKGFLEEIANFFTEILFLEYDNDYRKSVPANNLVEITTKLGINCRKIGSIKEANEYVNSIDDIDLLLITGSLYFASNYRDMSTEK